MDSRYGMASIESAHVFVEAAETYPPVVLHAHACRQQHRLGHVHLRRHCTAPPIRAETEILLAKLRVPGLRNSSGTSEALNEKAACKSKPKAKKLEYEWNVWAQTYAR